MMSVLQQILDQMFIDKEILDALDEEQKQILFIKMREEQVKRWKLFEDQCEHDVKEGEKKRSTNLKRIQWLTGSDGEVWVWVMGEHKDDLSVEEIMERRAQDQARKLAEQEVLENIRMDELDSVPEVSAYPSEDEQTLKQQLRQMVMNRSTEESPSTTEAAMRESVYEGVNMISGRLGSASQPSLSYASGAGVAATNCESVCGILYRGGLTVDRSSPKVIASSPNGFNVVDGMCDVSSKLYSVNSSQSLPVRPPRLKHLAQKNANAAQQVDNDDLFRAKAVPIKSDQVPIDGAVTNGINEGSGFARTTFDSAFDFDIGAAYLNVNCLKHNEISNRPIASQTQPTAEQSNVNAGDFSNRSVPMEIIPVRIRQEGKDTALQLQHPTTQLMYNRTSPIRNQQLTSNLISKSANSWQSGDNVKLRQSFPHSKSLPKGAENDIAKRQSEIYEMLREKQQNILREAELEAERERQAWEEQERKAKEAETQIRHIAQKAREQHRQQSFRTSTSILPALRDTKASSLREAIRNMPRPPKPKSRQAIVEWFRTDELQRGTGLDPKTRLPAPWFHGIISRKQADDLLCGKPAGSFLVRVSDRIWGYTVSYVVGDGITKHFLIERIPEGYQFLGTKQVVHDHLYDLIAYHETAPITNGGNEILRRPIGQSTNSADYSDLIDPEVIVSNALNANTQSFPLASTYCHRF